MQAVVLAAGLGIRLRPVTKDRSKAMVPVLGRPLVERAIAPLVDNGIRDFVFVVSPKDDEIVTYFTQSAGPRFKARFVAQEHQLGTAHALSVAAASIDGPFMVWACDSLVDRDHVGALLAAAEEADAVLSLLDVTPEMVSRSAAVALDGDSVRRIIEKPQPEKAPSFTVSLPHYVFNPRVLELLPRMELSSRGEYELAEAIQLLIDEGGVVVGMRATERRQVSSPEDLLQLTRFLLRSGEQGETRIPKSFEPGTRWIEPVAVDEGVVVGTGCEIGPEVYLESGARIDQGSILRRAIVLRGATVTAGETVEDRIVC